MKINSLSIIAGDHSESRSSASAIYQIIRQRLLSTTRDNMLPLVYLLDSILKNVKGFYIDLVQEDAEKWMPTVHQKLQDAQRAKLKKVWNTWEEFKIFSTDAWKAMGRCFDSQSSNGNSVIGSTLSNVAGIARTVRYFFVCMRPRLSLVCLHEDKFTHDASLFVIFNRPTETSSCRVQ